MTLFTHFVFFVAPAAAAAATPAGALPWQAADPLCTLAPLAPAADLPVPLEGPLAGYALHRARPTAAGGWLLLEAVPLLAGFDAERRQLLLRAPAKGLPPVAEPAPPAPFHLALVRRATAAADAAIVAVSNAFAAGAEPALTRRLRYRGAGASLLGDFADPELSLDLRLPLRVGWPQYRLGWAAGPTGPPAPVQQKHYRLLAERWPAAWVEALVFALQHDQVQLLHPLTGQPEPVALVGSPQVEWAAEGAAPLATVRLELQAIAFAPVALLYGEPPGGFAGGFDHGFAL